MAFFCDNKTGEKDPARVQRLHHFHSRPRMQGTTLQTPDGPKAGRLVGRAVHGHIGQRHWQKLPAVLKRDQTQLNPCLVLVSWGQGWAMDGEGESWGISELGACWGREGVDP